MASWKRFIIGYDPHGINLDGPTNKSFFKFIEQWKPEYRIAGGDIWDFKQLRKKADQHEKRESMAQDVAEGMSWMQELRPTHYLRGNHPHSFDTEVLTDRGWILWPGVRLDDKLAQFDIITRAISFAPPKALHRNWHEGEAIVIETSSHKQIVTETHNVVVGYEKIPASELVGRKITANLLPTTGITASPRLDISDEWLRVLIWTAMDGTIVDESKKNPKLTKARVQFKLSKPEKIERLRGILEAAGIPYTFRQATKSGVNKLQPYRFCVYSNAARNIIKALPGKLFPESWKDMNREQAQILMTEISHTDAHVPDNGDILWVSTEKQNIEVAGIIFLKNGIEMSHAARIKGSGFDNAKIQYHATIHSPTKKKNVAKPHRIPYKGYTYCATMPLGTLITRHSGKVAFSGNCERLWDLAEQSEGVVADYAKLCVQRLEDQIKSLKCRMYPYNKRDGVLHLGSLKVIHGFLTGVTAARRTALIYGSVAMGHGHGIQSATIEGLEPRAGFMCGCLCKLELQYNRAQPGTLNWEHGWAYGVVNEKTGSYQLWQARRIDDKWLLPTGIEIL